MEKLHKRYQSVFLFLSTSPLTSFWDFGILGWKSCHNEVMLFECFNLYNQINQIPYNYANLFDGCVFFLSGECPVKFI
jgi:regulation of enolase protein 1 (concanavalin A-like superfamily)